MRISAAESVVMEVLWEKSPQAADDIVSALKEERDPSSPDWSEKTIKTLLNRLLTKGVINASKDGRRYLYSPVITRDAYVRSESKGLIDRLFDGKLAPLVLHFAQERKLSKKDQDELKRLIAELDHDN
ncbi:MAG TPA: BlaI/MecI/CopY family transcriptional regulator [Micropepsaceae bacterium]|nr:BlaI/MecI/CopY family transcriptional regulator [Micropepsaceae bacterium]